MEALQQFQCPCCGGSISFDAQSQKMKCPYCDTEFDVETLRDYSQESQREMKDEMQWGSQAGSQWRQGESEGLRIYICQSCGGEILADAQTAATSCPYCGNPVVMMEQVSGSLRPDYVIPFRLDHNAAKEIMKKELKGKVLLPKAFKDENHLEEVKGIYVPFWLFDGDVDAHIRYRATKTRYWRDANYEYTETRHYGLVRGGKLGFERVPVDGSSKLADDMMESLEPYRTEDAVDFQTGYLAGYFADRYDVDAKRSEERANQRMKNSTQQAFRSTIHGFDTVRVESSSFHLTGGEVKYALYPVWLLTTRWNQQTYLFGINGQTGKFVGNLPVDKKAAFCWGLGMTALLSVLLYASAWILWLLGIF